MDFILTHFHIMTVLLCLSTIGIIVLSIYKKEYRDAFCDMFESLRMEIQKLFSDLRDTFR